MQQRHVVELRPARAAGRHLLAANDPHPEPKHKCPSCGTRYFEPQPCDWCVGDVHTVPADREEALA